MFRDKGAERRKWAVEVVLHSTLSNATAISPPPTAADIVREAERIVTYVEEGWMPFVKRYEVPA